jgi:hypothetical protein
MDEGASDMGTRGLMAFTVDGTTKAGYVHFDAYPSGLGADVLAWLRVEHAKPETLDAVRKLVAVNDETEPTTEQIEALKQYSNTNVSTKQLDEWYVLLRETQGNPALTLEAGYMYGVTKVEPYRLGCGHEYLYIVDFDAKTFSASGYGHDLGTWSFDQLPTKADFIAQTEDDD